MSCVIRCGCTLLAGFDVALSPDGGEHTQDRRYVFRQRVSVETHTDIAIHGQMSRGCEKGEQRKDVCGDSWLKQGIDQQNGMAHHDSIVADNQVRLSLVLLMLRPLLQPSRFQLPWFESSTGSMKESDLVERSPLPRRLVCAKWRLEGAFTWTVTKVNLGLVLSLWLMVRSGNKPPRFHDRRRMPEAQLRS